MGKNKNIRKGRGKRKKEEEEMPFLFGTFSQHLRSGAVASNHGSGGVVVTGFTVLVIIVTRVQVTLLLADITSALASSDADRVYFEHRVESFKVRRSLVYYA